MMNSDDIDGFFGSEALAHSEDHLLIDYQIKTFLEPRLASAMLCCEQSTAQWKRINHNEDLRAKFGAKTIALKALSVPSSTYQVRIAHPIHNFGHGISSLLSAIAGEGPFYCPGISDIKIKDIHFPKSYLSHFDGPQFGLDGLRQTLQIEARPIFIGVIKPNLGLPPENFAELAYQSWLGGLDIAKDDEMLGNTPWSPLAKRMKLSTEARRQAERESGKSKIMLANITDDMDQIPLRYQEAVSNGANAVMLNGLFTGLSSIRFLRKRSTVPIMGHFVGLALYDHFPDYGIDSVVLVKLQRISGCDWIGLPGFGERMHQTDEMVLRNIRACLEPMGNIKPALPIPGGSDWAGSLPKVFDKIGHCNFGFISGRGVFGHPEGPKEGARSLTEAWDAISKNIPVEIFAKTHTALNKALETFQINVKQ